MKHIKLFESFPAGSFPKRMHWKDVMDAIDSGDDKPDVLAEIKDTLLDQGIFSDRTLKAAKMLAWSALEIKDLVKVTEKGFAEMQEAVELTLKNGDIKLRPSDLTRVKVLLADKSRIMHAIKQL
jgi:hypothetical protein